MKYAYFLLGLLLVILACAGVSRKDDADTVATAPVKPRPAPSASSITPPKKRSAKTGLEEKKGTSLSDFQVLTRDTLDGLPRVRAIRENREDVSHGPPKSMFAAAAPLGKILETLEMQPELVTEGMRFYHACARNEELLSSVRSVCLRNLRYFAKQTGDEVREEDFDKEIRQVADKLPIKP